MAQGLDVVINGVETVSEKMDDIENSVRAANQALGSLSSELRESSISSDALEQSADSTSSSAGKLAASAQAAQSAVEEMGEESREAAAEVGFLGTVMDKTSVSAGALSINVGAFTIALRQLHTQIPLIVTTLGSFVSVLGGVGAAAGAAAGGISGLLAGGAIGLLEDIESQFADVTSTGEALQKLMSGLGDMFRQALDPLVNTENVELFVSLLENMANFANRSAQAIQASRDSIVQFFSVIAENGDFNRFAGSLQNVMEFEPGGEFDSAGEVLARFLGFIVEKLPDAIDFFNRVTTNLAGPLQEVGKQFQLLTIELVTFAEGAAPGFIDVIKTILSVFTGFFEALNNLNGSLTAAAVKAFAFTAILLRLAKVFDTVAALGVILANNLKLVFAGVSTFSGLTANLIAFGTGFLDQYANGILQLSRKFAAQVPILRSIQTLTDGLYKDDELIEYGDRVDVVTDNIKELAQTVKKRFTEFAIDGELVEAPKMGGFRSADTGQTVSLDLTADKFKQSLGTVKKRLVDVGRQGLKTGKTIAKGFGQFAIGALETFSATVVGALHPALIRSEGLTTFFNDGLSNMAEGLNKMGLGIIPRVVKGLVAKMGAMKAATIANLVYAQSFLALEKRAIQYAFAQKGVKAGLKQIAISAYSAVKGLLVYIGSTITATLASISFSAALGGLPLLLGAVVAGAALLVGAIGNADGIASSAKSSFGELKNFAVALGDALLGLLVPTFNLIVDIFMALLSPIFAIVDGFMLIFDAIGSAASQGEEGAGIMASFGAVMDVLGGIMSAIAPVFRVIGDILYFAFITPFKILATVIGFVISQFVKFLGLVSKFAKQSGITDALKGAAEFVTKKIQAAIDAVVGAVNFVIEKANTIPGVNVDPIGEGAGGASAKGKGRGRQSRYNQPRVQS